MPINVANRLEKLQRDFFRGGLGQNYNELNEVSKIHRLPTLPTQATPIYQYDSSFLRLSLVRIFPHNVVHMKKGTHFGALAHQIPLHGIHIFLGSRNTP